ncbi:MAG: acyl-CoA dehydrogenase family protein [Deltaproteobacteria bacterium]|nr:acyl-CoA dehydrogenase family protein [Deltaproteobacteria bacterium]
MEIRFSFEEREIRRSVRKFVKNELLPVCREVDDTGVLPDAVKDKLFSMGLLKASFPEAWGGAGGTFTGLVIALKELSYATLVPAWLLFENFMLAYPLLNYGSDALKSAYLEPLLSLNRIGAFAFTEADTGSDPLQLKTVAQKVEQGWLINGSKRFITHSGICDHLLLFAKTGDGVSAFLIESKRKGYRAGKRESFIHVRGFDNGDLYLEDYLAPDDHLIGRADQGFEILLKTEAVGKIAFCALFVGMAQRALDLAVTYALHRTHRGKPIGARFQMTQVKLANMVTKIEAMKAYLFHVCALADQGKDVFMEAAALKLFVAGEIKGITSDAMEIHGAYGLSREYDIAGLYQTAISAQAVMGSLDIQRVIVAKSALSRMDLGG